MIVLSYFDLGLMPLEPKLGINDKEALKKRSQKRLFLTLLMYFGIVVGILTENLLSLMQANETIIWSNFGFLRVILSLIVALAIFPQVFPRRLGRDQRADHYFLQFCIAFQNGYFWKALLDSISTMVI